MTGFERVWAVIHNTKLTVAEDIQELSKDSVF